MLHVLEQPGKQADLADQWPFSKAARGAVRHAGCDAAVSPCHRHPRDLHRAEVAPRQGDPGSKASACGDAADRRCVVDGEERARRIDGGASLWRALPTQMETAEA